MAHVMNLIEAAVRRGDGLPDDAPIDPHAPMSHEAFSVFVHFLKRTKVKPARGHVQWFWKHTTPHDLAKQMSGK